MPCSCAAEGEALVTGMEDEEAGREVAAPAHWTCTGADRRERVGGWACECESGVANSALGGGEDEHGTIEVESNLESFVLPPTATATATASIVAPIAKLEVNGYHSPPLLLPQTREAKQELIERPLGGLLGLKHFISASSTLSHAQTGAFGVADGSGPGV